MVEHGRRVHSSRGTEQRLSALHGLEHDGGVAGVDLESEDLRFVDNVWGRDAPAARRVSSSSSSAYFFIFFISFSFFSFFLLLYYQY